MTYYNILNIVVNTELTTNKIKDSSNYNILWSIHNEILSTLSAVTIITHSI